MRRRVAIGVALLASCARPRPAPLPDAPPPREPVAPAAPLAAHLGSWHDETGKFERRARFPKVEGQSFGWKIKIRCTGPVKFREVMRLPAPGDWTFTPEELPGTTISEDQTTTTTVDYAACKQGWIEHQWTVAEGDPVGTYVITVELDGYATQTFRPKFVAPDR